MWHAMLGFRRVPRVEMKNAAVGGDGWTPSRYWAYWVRAVTVLGCTGIARDFPNLESRIVITAAARSTSPRSKRQASPTRMPLVAKSPIRVV